MFAVALSLFVLATTDGAAAGDWRAAADRWVAATSAMAIAGDGAQGLELWAHRERIGEELTRSMPPHREILAALRASAEDERLRALAAVAVLGAMPEGGTPVVVRSLSAQSDDERTLSILALAKASPAQILPSRDEIVRSLAVEREVHVAVASLALAERLGPDAVPVLAHLFSFPDAKAPVLAWSIARSIGPGIPALVRERILSRGPAGEAALRRFDEAALRRSSR
jgi:hypothetical protein